MIVPHDPESDNAEEQATLEGWRGKGAGSVQGTLTQYSVYVSLHHSISILPSSVADVLHNRKTATLSKHPPISTSQNSPASWPPQAQQQTLSSSAPKRSKKA